MITFDYRNKKHNFKIGNKVSLIFDFRSGDGSVFERGEKGEITAIGDSSSSFATVKMENDRNLIVNAFTDIAIIEDSDNKEITILFHSISYWYDNGQDMPDSEQEHIQDMITQGYIQGELNDNNENRGWWSIA